MDVEQEVECLKRELELWEEKTVVKLAQQIEPRLLPPS